MNNRILFLVSVPFYKSSGSPQAVFMKTKAFCELGFDIDIVCYPHGDDIAMDGLNIIRAPKKRMFRNYLPGQFRKKLIYDSLIFIRACSLLIKNDYHFVVAAGTMIYYGRILKFFYRRKFIAIEHGNLKTELAKWNVLKNNFFGNLFRKIEVATLNTYSLIISEAYQNIQPLFASGLKESKVNYLRLTSFSSPVLEKTIQTDNFVVLYTGSFVKVQNLNLLYETAKLLANEKIEFRLIGGEEFQIEEEKSRTEYLKNVKFYKRLPQKEFEEFMRSADIVVSLRTFGEDCPQKIVDYLNYGKCILASNAKLHFEFLDQQNSYLANPFPEDFAKAIITLRDDEPLRKSLAARGKLLFEEELSYGVMKVKLSKLLKNNHLL